MKPYIQIFVFNMVVGPLFSIGYYVGKEILHMPFLYTAIIINIVGALIGCLEYYYGVKNAVHN